MKLKYETKQKNEALWHCREIFSRWKKTCWKLSRWSMKPYELTWATGLLKLQTGFRIPEGCRLWGAPESNQHFLCGGSRLWKLRGEMHRWCSQVTPFGKELDVNILKGNIGQSWLTHLTSVAWRPETEPVKQQTHFWSRVLKRRLTQNLKFRKEGVLGGYCGGTGNHCYKPSSSYLTVLILSMKTSTKTFHCRPFIPWLICPSLFCFYEYKRDKKNDAGRPDNQDYNHRQCLNCFLSDWMTRPTEGSAHPLLPRRPWFQPGNEEGIIFTCGCNSEF